MIKNYFTIAWRTLTHNKLYTALNVAGLTFGLTCFLLIGLYIFDELTFDQHHSKADNIYRVIEHRETNGEATTIAAGSYKLAEESRKTIAGVENTTRLQRIGRDNLVNPDNPVNFHETITITNEQFLQIFDFPLLSGDRKTALRDPNSIVINEELAMRLFGRTDVVGKRLAFAFMDAPLKVTGVLKNLPRNSSFDFNLLLSESSFVNSDYYKELAATDWLSNNFSIYVLVKPGSDAGQVAGRMTKLVYDNYTPPAGTRFSFSLQSLNDIHLGSADIFDGARNTNVDATAKGSIFYIKIFSFISLFVLLIAGINYMNLTTARASIRLKEIGIRKSIGALKSQLAWQFLVESFIVTIIAFVLAVICINLLLPSFNQFTHRQLSLGLSTDYRIWLLAIAFTILLGFLSGSYPAVLLSRFKAVLLLKGLKLHHWGDLSVRRALVVFQFSISILMIIATIVMFRQVRFMDTTDLGFNKDLLLVIDINTRKARANFEAVKTEMAKIPTVKSVSVTSRVPGEWKSFRMIRVKRNGNNNDPLTAYMFGADKDFLTTYEANLLKGRNFGTPSDSACVILNETAARMLNITDPSGQLIDIPAVSDGGTFDPLNASNTPFQPRVIGIVKDFHFQSLRDRIEPLVIAYNRNPIHQIDYYSARISAANIAGTLRQLKAVMLNNDKDDPFEFHFLDDQLARFYLEDRRRQSILTWTAIATIFIACLGLFGLATYAAEQRVKEIGIRKVLGASVSSLAALLSKDFLKLVIFANIIAFPAGWWAANQWLRQFAYHIDVEWWIFILAGLSALVIAVVTVSYQAIMAARSNPVKSLRSE